MRVRRLGVLGGFLRGPETVLTQYRQPVGDFDHAPEALTAMIDHLARRKDWSELVIQLAPKNSPMVACLHEEAAVRGWYLRAMETVPSYVVEMQGTFLGYCKTLTPSVRRRLLLQRRRLASLGSVNLQYADSATAAEALALLNRFHEGRAGAPALGPQVLDFHLRLIQGLSDPSSLRLSTLSVSGRPVSVNYALRMREREYGVAMGFDDRFDPRISLGTLHLGYALEDAWAGGVKSHDLMTSWRGQEGWKAQLANRTIELVDLQLIRRRSLAALYRAYDKLAAGVPRLRASVQRSKRP